ncbi:MAG: hypothetical protein HOO67_07805 [Candidatus Peribacteraceae bacterium]|nr:hypothetical protein [Candidatus Peribacteraceae bacterium]
MPAQIASSSAPRLAFVHIDCSRSTEGNGEMEHVLEWISRHPASSSIHVTQRSILSGCVPRKHQALLQSLGCTVTAKVRC